VGSIPGIKLLLNFGANALILNNKKKSPLDAAKSMNRYDAVDFLESKVLELSIVYRFLKQRGIEIEEGFQVTEVDSEDKIVEFLHHHDEIDLTTQFSVEELFGSGLKQLASFYGYSPGVGVEIKPAPVKTTMDKIFLVYGTLMFYADVITDILAIKEFGDASLIFYFYCSFRFYF